MKITWKHGNRFLEFQRQPMPDSRFKAVCLILLALLYAGAVVSLVVSCGFDSIMALLLLTIAFGGVCVGVGVFD